MDIIDMLFYDGTTNDGTTRGNVVANILLKIIIKEMMI
jgi:hypothetical protein